MLISEGIDLSPEYNCVISEWKITKKLKIKIVKDDNSKIMKNKNFNLFFNENYGELEVKDIVKAFKKISNYYLKIS